MVPNEGANISTSPEPVRAQLSRTKGWRMPENTVKVDRTTIFGNPWPVGVPGPGGFVAKDKRHAWQLFLGFAETNEKLAELAVAQLRGKNLACWCALPTAPFADDECHAAVLLKIANAEVRHGK